MWTGQLSPRYIWPGPVIDGPAYTAAATELGSLLKDQETKPLDRRAIWWIEHAVRHPNLAEHYRSPANQLPWHQFYLLDIVAFILFLLVLVFITSFAMIYFVIRLALSVFVTKCKID